MIVRVDIENLVIVERAEFAPGTGLTAITGETGAGKTLLATAIALLFGGDADAGQVGPASDQAWIEGEFEVDDAFWSHPDVTTLAGLRPEDDTPLVLARRVERSGRSRAMAWGRTVAKTDLAAAGRLLVATAGQHVQVRLRSSEHQRATLDGAGGVAQSVLLTEMHEAWAALTATRVEHARVEQLVADSALHADRLRDDLARIDLVQPSAEDAAELRGARDRARHHVTLVEALAGAASTLEGRDGGSAVDLVGRAYASLQHGAQLDPGLEDLAGQLLALQEQLADAASVIGSRLGDLEAGPASLDDIEERLSAYAELERHFGGTVESVLAAWADLRVQVAAIDDASGALGETQARVAAAETMARSVAQRLTDARCLLADRLSADVRDSLAELGMGGSVFRVDVGEHELGLHGGDRIAFLLAPSAGIEPRPVAQVASGGELSRIALALLVATSTGADGAGAGTILFDEIDAGIGGHTAHAVATLLRRLADQRQVLCITHLPQVAARAEAHVVIEKHQTGGEVRTTLRALPNEAAVVDELVRMLGADASDDAARDVARQLRGPRFDIAGGAPAASSTAKPKLKPRKPAAR